MAEASSMSGPLYIGGTHPAANGGAWMVAVQGFGGLRHYADHLSLAPRLPESWTEISFKTTWRGCTVSFHITPDLVNAKAAPENPLTVPLQIGTERLSLAPGAGILRKP
jgi:nigerose phosphorylase